MAIRETYGFAGVELRTAEQVDAFLAARNCPVKMRKVIVARKFEHRSVGNIRTGKDRERLARVAALGRVVQKDIELM